MQFEGSYQASNSLFPEWTN